MDNLLQIEEIQKYRKYLSSMTGEDVDEETAALIWIGKYAKSWRINKIRLSSQAA